MDGQEQTPVVSPEVVDSQETQAPEPVDIAQAFQFLRESNKEATAPAEPEGEPTVGAEPDNGDAQPAVQPMAMPSEPAEPAVPDSANTGGDLGGSTAAQPPADYQAVGQGIVNRVREQARQEILKEFQDHNIKIVSINDIYEKGEDGSVRFNNPDNPRRPFESRAEAQAWVDSINAQIQNEYQTRIAKRAGELWQEAQPQIQLLQFAPYYQQMDEVTQNVFDQLIEPYSIMQNGKVVGFNCNLAQVAQQAIKIVQSFNARNTAKQETPAQPKQQPVQPATTPAMDMKTGSGESDDSGEPKNINEAMALLNKQRKEKRNG